MGTVCNKNIYMFFNLDDENWEDYPQHFAFQYSQKVNRELTSGGFSGEFLDRYAVYNPSIVK